MNSKARMALKKAVRLKATIVLCFYKVHSLGHRCSVSRFKNLFKRTLSLFSKQQRALTNVSRFSFLNVVSFGGGDELFL